MIIKVDYEYTCPTELHLHGAFKRCYIRLLGIPLLTFHAKRVGRFQIKKQGISDKKSATV